MTLAQAQDRGLVRDGDYAKRRRQRLQRREQDDARSVNNVNLLIAKTGALEWTANGAGR